MFHIYIYIYTYIYIFTDEDVSRTIKKVKISFLIIYNK